MIKVISVAAMIAGLATASTAGAYKGGEEDNVVETVFAPAGSSSAGMALPLAIAGGVVAIGLIAGSSNSDDPVVVTTGDED